MVFALNDFVPCGPTDRHAHVVLRGHPLGQLNLRQGQGQGQGLFRGEFDWLISVRIVG